MKVKFCLKCGKEIPPDAGGKQANRKMYCNGLCKDAMQKARRRAREKGLMPPYELPASATITKPCRICGKPFEVKDNGNARNYCYCSDRCRAEAHRTQNRVRKQIIAANRHKLGECALECDPWVTGQLPESVLRNALV